MKCHDCGRLIPKEEVTEIRDGKEVVICYECHDSLTIGTDKNPYGR